MSKEPIEKELEYMTNERNMYSSQVEELKEELKNKEKDKISFCIDKLKNIRREIIFFTTQRTNETFFIDGKKFRGYIDSQIKEIKKENKNV